MKHIPLVSFFALALFATQIVQAEEVPEAARRHLLRGQAAVEMAKTPNDYAAAIKEFEEASRLAPDWAEVYLYLGAVQEEVKRYAGAIKSYKRYLSLAPNAADTRKVRDLVVKLEFKLERQNKLTREDIINLFVDVGNSHSGWLCKNESTNDACAALDGRFYSHQGSLIYENRPPGIISGPHKNTVKINGRKAVWQWIQQFETNALIQVINCNVKSGDLIQCLGKTFDNSTNRFVLVWPWRWEKR